MSNQRQNNSNSNGGGHASTAPTGGSVTLSNSFQREAQRIVWRRQEMEAGRVAELIELGRRVKWREALIAPPEHH